MQNIIADECETPTFDDFKAWYLSETIEAVGLGCEFINLKRIWLGQKIFTFCDVSSCGYITETSFRKALERLNISVPSKRLESILSQFSDKERRKNYIKEANELPSTRLDISSFCTWFCNYTPFSNVMMKRALSFNTSSHNNAQRKNISVTLVVASDARTAIASSIFNSIDATLKGFGFKKLFICSKIELSRRHSKPTNLEVKLTNKVAVLLMSNHSLNGLLLVTIDSFLNIVT